MTVLKTLTKRERNIAVVTIVAAVLFLLYTFVLSPLSDQYADIAGKRDKVATQLADADRLFVKQRGLQKIWTEIQAGGLKANRSQAESQAQQAALDWARQAGISVVSLKPDRDTQENQFQIISFHLTGTGSMLSISRMLMSLEKARIPVRLNDMQITPKKEATDDLSVQLSISTLALLPEAPKSATANSVAMADRSVR
jgi:hypothetical protein